MCTCASVSGSNTLDRWESLKPCCPLLERRMGVSSGLRSESCRLTVMVTAAVERRRRSGLSRGGVKPWPRPSRSSLGLKWPVTGGELLSITPPFPLSLERPRGRRNKPSVRFLLWLWSQRMSNVYSGNSRAARKAISIKAIYKENTQTIILLLS